MTYIYIITDKVFHKNIWGLQITWLCLALLPLALEHELGVEEVQPLRPGVHLEEDLGRLQSSPGAPEVQRMVSQTRPEIDDKS